MSGFHRIRNVLIRRYGALRKEVYPGARIQHFLNQDIRAQWPELGKAIGASQLPRLRCRRILFYPVVTGLPVVGGALAALGGIPTAGVIATVVVLLIAGSSVARWAADIVPEHVSTLRGLAVYAGIEDQTEWTYDFVLQRVIWLASQQLGVPEEQIHPDSHFVTDLGMDR